MLSLILKKMLNRRWLTVLLAAGFVLVVALVSVIPLFTDGVLQKVLTADLEAAQAVDNVFPGNYLIKANLEQMEAGARLAALAALKKNVLRELVPQIPLPALSVTEEVTLAAFRAAPADKAEATEGWGSANVNIFIRALADMEAHITVTHGRFCADSLDDQTVEAVATAPFLKENDFHLNDTLVLKGSAGAPFTRVRIVGVFAVRDPRDTYWAKSPDFATVFVSHALFEKEIAGRGRPLVQGVEWNIAFDYHALTVAGLGPLLAALDAHERLADRYRRALTVEFRVRPILERYGARAAQLRLTLLILDVPVFLLLFFFIVMISHLVVAGERTEIAVLKSRGISTGRVFLMYLGESLALGLAGLLLGPPLGFLFGKLMGASSGFLEFVRRAPVPLALSPSAYLHALAAVLCLVLARLAPAYAAARVSIVELKRQSAREEKTPFWRKIYADVLLLAAAAYGLYRYQSRETILSLTGASSLDIGLDPLLFLASTFFILGAGLLFLRLFPLLVRLVHGLGKKRWSPVMYYALLSVERTGGRGQFLMLFLIFSLAIGVLSAAMARTLNRNVEDRVRYRLGADIVLSPAWAEEATVTARGAGPEGPPPGLTLSEEEEARFYNVSRLYREPPFAPFAGLEGVGRAAKVFVTESGQAALGSELVSGVRLLGIVPHEFGEVSWFRSGLLPHHWHQYLNLLADAPAALLVSRSFQARYKLEPGDQISFTWGNQAYIQGTIYAFVDYWPGYDPHKDARPGGGAAHLVVANLSYLQNKLAKEPYQIWIRKKPGVPDETVYRDIERRRLPLRSAESLAQTLAAQKNDPLLKGLNASLTLGFLLIMAVCAAGFLFYWTLSLRGRILQFGVLRAMGLSRRRVLALIVLEQLFMSGTAVVMGIVIGWGACRLFVPALELVFTGAAQAPPFQVVALRGDYLRIIALVLGMLGAGLVFLRWFIRRLKIGSALKLGEE